MLFIHHLEKSHVIRSVRIKRNQYQTRTNDLREESLQYFLALSNHCKQLQGTLDWLVCLINYSWRDVYRLGVSVYSDEPLNCFPMTSVYILSRFWCSACAKTHPGQNHVNFNHDKLASVCASRCIQESSLRWIFFFWSPGTTQTDCEIPQTLANASNLRQCQLWLTFTSAWWKSTYLSAKLKQWVTVLK